MEMYRPDSNLDWNHVTQKRLSIFSLKYVAAKLENLAPDGTEKLIHDPEDIKLLMGTGMTETDAEDVLTLTALVDGRNDLQKLSATAYGELQQHEVKGFAKRAERSVKFPHSYGDVRNILTGGNWATAVDAAGLTPTRKGSGGGKAIPDEDLRAALRSFYEANGKNVSFMRPSAYETWRQENDNSLPTSATISRRLGGGKWRAAVEKVVDDTHTPTAVTQEEKNKQTSLEALSDMRNELEQKRVELQQALEGVEKIDPKDLENIVLALQFQTIGGLETVANGLVAAAENDLSTMEVKRQREKQEADETREAERRSERKFTWIITAAVGVLALFPPVLDYFLPDIVEFFFS